MSKAGTTAVATGAPPEASVAEHSKAARQAAEVGGMSGGVVMPTVMTTVPLPSRLDGWTVVSASTRVAEGHRGSDPACCAAPAATAEAFVPAQAMV